MKQKRHVHVWFLAFFFLSVGGTLFFPPIGNAQGYPSWWGSNQWWDWSDFRGSTGVRFWMPRLISGSVSWSDSDLDLLSANYGSSGGYNFLATPDFFKEGWFKINVDRLALRAYFEEDHKFNGMIGTRGDPPASDSRRFSELDVGWTRFGLDLDLIRYPFLRAGINADRHNEAPIFINRYNVFQKLTTRQPPVTIGVHFLAIPATIWEIPITIQGRGRIPMPLINQLIQASGEAKVTDWEISAGCRPNVWHTSLLGYATFAMGMEVGFRWTALDMFVVDGTWRVKANWQGGFVQVGAYF